MTITRKFTSHTAYCSIYMYTALWVEAEYEFASEKF